MSSPAMVTYPSQPHALPFRTILGEYRVRREQDLAGAVSLHIIKSKTAPQDVSTVWVHLETALTKSEDAYCALAAAKDLVQNIARDAGESQKDYDARVVLGQKQVVRCEQECKKADDPLKRILHEMQGTAICLSGGGIRSASFSLGVLEGLARFSRRGLDCTKSTLDRLDYLSTVSGGGYIGSWLMAWAKRSTYHDVVTHLAKPAASSADPEPAPIRHLRAYTSYLTPRYGFTLDTLTLAAIVMRNMVLNWLILVPAIIALMCVPQLLYMVSYALPLHAAMGGGWYHRMMWSSLVFVAVAAIFAAYRTSQPTRRPKPEDEQDFCKKAPQREKRFLPEFWLFVLPLLLGSWILGEVWLRGALHQGKAAVFGDLFRWMFPFALIPPFSMALVRLRLVRNPASPFRKHDGSNRISKGRVVWSLLAPILIAGLAASLLAGCAYFLRTRLFHEAKVTIATQAMDSQAMFVISIPLIWMVLMVASSFLSGLLSNIETEEEREWWARAGGLLFAYLLAWVGVNIIALYAHEIVRTMYGAYSILAFGTAAGYTASMAGFSSATANGLKRVKLEQLSKTGQWLAKHRAIVPVLSGIALLCITIALADFTIWLRYVIARHISPHAHVPFEKFRGMGWGQIQVYADASLRTHLLAALIILVCAATLAIIGNRFINVNTFSLHGMYRMRLTRAYLGASNFARHPDAFTNFDFEDNIYEDEVPHETSGSDGASPLHIIGTALNLVGTQRLAWQQRKAESFTFSPVSCGSWRLGYCRTSEYGGSRGVRLGTAMAISGAAVNPNMGYHSSPLVTILMTLFNARLGWWLPNPIWPELQGWDVTSHAAKKHLHRNGPKWALMPLLNEALGRTDDRYRWIELSDGGHFENLGLYEMVMRRCHNIVLVDADADSEYQFDDLGNAIRKIQIDLGIPITFPEYGKVVPMQAGVKEGNIYCLEGEIDYGCVDSEAKKGHLLYIKPVLNGSEPPDIRAYRANHQEFPHEPTSNQFFNEAQFESYRHLGSWVVEALTSASREHGNTMDAFFTAARHYRAACLSKGSGGAGETSMIATAGSEE